MRKLRAALGVAAAIGALAVAGVASAATIGVNEDETKTDTSLYAGIADVGLKQNILSLTWAAGQGIPSGQQTVIRNAITAAAAKGVKIVLTVYPAAGNASAFGNLANKGEFVTYLTNVVKSFPQVKSIIVGNEPNRTLFMNPVNGGSYAQILADAYDAIKGVDPSIQVVGVGLSPRGSGDGSSQFPPQFIKQMGDWYRSSGRTKPLMDAFSFHPYPFPVNKPPTGVSDWPTVGMPDLYRLKQAIWDAFNGTAQPTVEDGLKLTLDELAYQVPTDGKAGYSGAENVETVDEATQATYYAQLVNMVACDPSIESLNFFHFIDETNRAGFQSGMLDASKAQRPVYSALKSAIAATGGGANCTGTPMSWKHETGVLGFKGDLGGVKAAYPKTVSSITAKVRVEENATVTISLLDSTGKAVDTETRALKAAPQANTEFAADVKLGLDGLKDGDYTLQVTAVAEQNDKRSSTATSGKITIGQPGGSVGGKAPGKCKKPAFALTFHCNGTAAVIDKCKTGYADVDGNVSNGCEVNLLTDPKNCGKAGNVVAGACFNGVGVDPKPYKLTAKCKDTFTVKGPGGSLPGSLFLRRANTTGGVSGPKTAVTLKPDGTATVNALSFKVGDTIGLYLQAGDAKPLLLGNKVKNPNTQC